MINISNIPGMDSLTQEQRALVNKYAEDGHHIDPSDLNLDVVAQYGECGRIEVLDLGGGKALIHYHDYISADGHSLAVVDDWREAAIDWLTGWDAEYYDDLDQWLMDWGIPDVEIVEASPDSPGPYRLWITYFYQVRHHEAPRDTWLDIESDDNNSIGPCFDREVRRLHTYERYDEALAARDILDARIHETRLDGDMERMDYGEYASPRVIVRSVGH